MAKTVTIKLDAPLTGHNGERCMQVIVREPTFNEYLDNGDPYLVALAPQSGIPFQIEDKQAIAAYARLLIVEPKDPLLLEQGGMALAGKVKEAIRSFFLPAGGAGADSRTSPTN
jgi:hypothetical protein